MSPHTNTPRTKFESNSTLGDAAPYLDQDPTSLPESVDPFTITTSTGFMPLHVPLIELPHAFSAAAKLADDMPVTKADGTPGLLSDFTLGPTIDAGVLPDLTAEIENLRTADGKGYNMAAVTAIFRDYSFLASAYLLEPCWEKYCSGLEGYGLGRQVLPACLAGPLVKTADILEIPAFMAYAAAYSLYNYRFHNSSIGYDEYSNLRLIRAFEHGLDPKSSEAGFILTHVDMVKHSSGLVKGAVDLLSSVSQADHAGIKHSYELLLETMRAVEASMETMWTNSRPKDYISYRTFIFGITNQSMFPEGVVYQGQNDGKPMSFRGESGANDAMIPLLDSLLQVPMPPNPLTEILKDFRSYRPKPHRDFLAAVRAEAEAVGVRQQSCKDTDTAVLYLRLLDHVRSFRWRHWLFAREYIIRRTSHPTATGGSPIIRWLPNQLFAVMELMQSVWEVVRAGGVEVEKHMVDMMENVAEQREKLKVEVERWCDERKQ